MRFAETNHRMPSQQELADALGVSRGAVRGRLMRLAEGGYVEMPAGAPWRLCMTSEGLHVRLSWAIESSHGAVEE